MDTIYESGDLRVLYRPGRGPRSWVTFGAADADGPFGEGLIAKRGEESVFIVPKRIHFYQLPEMARVLKLVDRTISRRGRIAYGSSMGAFAALAWALEIKAEQTIAASPLVSVHPEIVGDFDQRWRAFSHSLDYQRADARRGNAQNVTAIYDPCHPIDRKHAQMIRVHQRIEAPFAGHAALHTLREAGVLEALITSVIDGVGVAPLLEELKTKRRRLALVWIARADYLEHRGRHSAAARLFAKAAQADPGYTHFRRSHCLSALGRHLEAYDAAAAAAKANPGFAAHAESMMRLAFPYPAA